MLKRHEIDITLISFLLISLLLHLVILIATGKIDLTSRYEQVPEPVVVEMLDRTDTNDAEEGERELSENRAPEDNTPNLLAQRRGDANRLSPTDKAPIGEDLEDVAPPAMPKGESQKDIDDSMKPPEVSLPKSQSEGGEYKLSTSDEGKESPDLPTLTQLYQVPQQTRERVSAEALRTKYRKNVDDADAVWLNTKTDILFSFFRRFKDNVYLSWNYPAEAAKRHESGECLLKIEISRKGTVNKIDLVESTGFDRLDNEAISAVRKESPFGPLPEAFTKDVLKLYVVFQYNLQSQAVF